MRDVMKCDDCLNLLEVYIDAEAGERDTEQVRAHLIVITLAGFAVDVHLQKI